MKKILFLIAGLFLFFYAVGQTPSSNVVTATMPKGATRLTRAQLINIVHNNYKKSGIPLDKGNTYQLNGILISFWDLSVNPEFKKSLKASQSEMVGYLSRNKENIIHYSQIIKVNNIHYLVCEYQNDDEIYLWFKSDYNKNDKDINGVIQFKKPDEDKAHKALDDFLSTVHFKE